MAREVAGYLGNTPGLPCLLHQPASDRALRKKGVTIAEAVPHRGDGGAEGIPTTGGLAERAVLRMLRHGDHGGYCMESDYQ
ncbi:hypothetical protein GCM10022233_69560 [Streptomyces shaanxiensis]|uniref:Uncharacterized protein n=1 Tax=Streptomyces shaanxiensis TaxID=653357 RepID=A0ABP7W2Y7_9ACTN